jgi:hypothetical protein
MDMIHASLSYIYASLRRSAVKHGVDPSKRTKAEFAGDEKAKQVFIAAWGQEAYDGLKDDLDDTGYTMRKKV